MTKINDCGFWANVLSVHACVYICVFAYWLRICTPPFTHCYLTEYHKIVRTKMNSGCVCIPCLLVAVFVVTDGFYLAFPHPFATAQLKIAEHDYTIGIAIRISYYQQQWKEKKKCECRKIKNKIFCWKCELFAYGNCGKCSHYLGFFLLNW